MDTTDIFGPAVSIYTPADAIADGSMIELPGELTREAGYRLPIVMTRAAWAEAVQWERGTIDNDETGRAWDVLHTARAAAKHAVHAPEMRFMFHLYRVPNRTASGALSNAEIPQRITLDLVAQGYDTAGTPCLTILVHGED